MTPGTRCVGFASCRARDPWSNTVRPGGPCPSSAGVPLLPRARSARTKPVDRRPDRSRTRYSAERPGQIDRPPIKSPVSPRAGWKGLERTCITFPDRLYETAAKDKLERTCIAVLDRSRLPARATKALQRQPGGLDTLCGPNSRSVPRDRFAELSHRPEFRNNAVQIGFGSTPDPTGGKRLAPLCMSFPLCAACPFFV